MGFAEESMREEDAVLEDVEELDDVDFQEPLNSGDLIIRLFRAGHPKEYDWLVRKIIKQRLEWAAAAEQRGQKDEFQEEVEAIERTLYDEDVD